MQAASHGIPVRHLWAMTPRELGWEIEGAAARQDRERQAMMSAAWHTAAFHRVKRLPPHERIMRKMTRRRRPTQTVEQQIAMARLITAQWRGSHGHT